MFPAEGLQEFGQLLTCLKCALVRLEFSSTTELDETPEKGRLVSRPTCVPSREWNRLAQFRKVHSMPSHADESTYTSHLIEKKHHQPHCEHEKVSQGNLTNYGIPFRGLNERANIIGRVCTYIQERGRSESSHFWSIER